MSMVLLIGLIWLMGLVLAVMEVLAPKTQRTVQWLGIAFLGGALAWLVTYWPGSSVSKAQGSAFQADGFALFVQAVIVLGVLGAMLAEKAPLALKQAGATGLLMLSAAGAMLFACAFDMVFILVGFLGALMPIWTLAAASATPNGREAALKGLVVGALGAGLFGLGTALLVVRVRATGLVEIARYLSCADWIGFDPMLVASVVCLLTGMGCMVALVPFHMWFVDMMQGLSTPGSMILSGSVMVGGLAAFARVLLVGFQHITNTGQGYLSWISILYALSMTALLACNVMALVQRRFKRMAAYLVVGQVGLVGLTLAAIGQMGALKTASAEALGGVLVFLAFHVVSWLGLFVVQSAMEAGDGSDPEVGSLEGLAHRRPWLALSAGMALLCMAGMPPSAGFFSRLYLLKALVDAGWITTAVVAALSSGLVLVMGLGLVASMVQQPVEPKQPLQSSWSIRLVAILSSAAILVFGILPAGILDVAIRSAQTLWIGN